MKEAVLKDKEEPPLKRVLLVGDIDGPSAPFLSLAKELNRLGVETLFSGDTIWSDTRKWLTLALRCGVMVFVQYRPSTPFFEAQLYRAKMLGCRVVRWWVGSDVMFARESQENINAAKVLDKVVDLNIAVSPHLVVELGEIGITSEYIPSPCDLTGLENGPVSNLPRGVLAYLPTQRKAFYGETVLKAAIEANPDLQFYIVNDESHSLAHYPNVNSLGWVQDMEAVWSQVGLLLRVTEHDGMPRMVLEALSRSRYVIYSEVFEACWLGKSTEEVLQHLEGFKKLPTPNIAGPELVHSIAGNAAPLYAQKLASQCTPALSLRRVATILFAARWVVMRRFKM